MKNQNIAHTIIFTISAFFLTNNIIAAGEVEIGNQIWGSANIATKTFRNGDAIPEAQTNEEWEKAGKDSKPAWCYYNSDSDNGEKYGLIYNWHAIVDARGLAPNGWRVPSDKDWKELSGFLGEEGEIGIKMKNNLGWENNGNGTNELDFFGLPGGARADDNSFLSVGFSSYWWSTTEQNEQNAWYRSLYHDKNYLGRTQMFKRNGMYVRCIRN